MNNAWKKWLNPFYWIGAVWNALASMLRGILRFLGLPVPQPVQRHDDLTTEDVDNAYRDASTAEAISDLAPEIDQKARGFLRYIDSPPEERAAFDLSVFDSALQHFILGLSEDDIQELRRRGPVGQLQAALIRRIPPRLEMPTSPDAVPEPSKADLVRERFLRAVRGRPQDDTDTYLPEYAPGR